MKRTQNKSQLLTGEMHKTTTYSSGICFCLTVLLDGRHCNGQGYCLTILALVIDCSKFICFDEIYSKYECLANCVASDDSGLSILNASVGKTEITIHTQTLFSITDSVPCMHLVFCLPIQTLWGSVNMFSAQAGYRSGFQWQIAMGSIYYFF